MVSSSSSSRASLPERPARRRRPLLQILRRVVADLLQRGQELETRPRRAMPSAASISAMDLAHHRLVQRGLFAGERDRVVGLRLGRQFGGDARVGLLAAQQERPDQPGQALGAPPGPRRSPRRAAWRARNVFSGPSSPGSSSRAAPTARRGCSPPGCRSARRGPAAGWCAAPSPSPTYGFLTCCASSATTMPQGCSASSAARRAHGAVGGEDETAVHCRPGCGRCRGSGGPGRRARTG